MKTNFTTKDVNSSAVPQTPPVNVRGTSDFVGIKRPGMSLSMRHTVPAISCLFKLVVLDYLVSNIEHRLRAPVDIPPRGRRGTSFNR